MLRKLLSLLFLLTSASLLTACAGDTPDSKFSQITESEHFTIYSFNEDADALDTLLKTLEDNFERITSVLRVTLREKSVVEVYPDIDAFHDALIDELAKAFADEIADGRAGELPTGFDDWVVGVYINGKIMMTSPNNPGSAHDYESLVTVVVHEFVHLVTAQINADAPSILNEGIAVTLADQPVNIKDTLGAAIKNGSFPAVSELESLPASDLYPYGRALVEFIISEYGNDTLMELYKNPDFQVVFGINEDEFREKWMEFITEEYRDKSIPESILPNNNP